MTKTFSLKQLFSLVDGRLSTNIGDVYEMLNHICDDDLMTHHLPVASDYVKSKNPKWFIDVKAKIDILKSKFGNDFSTIMEAIDSGYNEKFEIPQLKDEFEISDFPRYMVDNSLLLKKLKNKSHE